MINGKIKFEYSYRCGMKADSWRRKPHNDSTEDFLERFSGNTILSSNTLFFNGICVVGLLNAQRD